MLDGGGYDTPEPQVYNRIKILILHARECQNAT